MASAARRKSTSPLGDDHQISQIARLFHLLSDESRLRILLLLAREGEMHVSNLCEKLEQSQSAISHSLMQLRLADLVEVRRDGKYHYYRVDAERLGELIERFVDPSGRGRSWTLGRATVTVSSSARRR